MGAQWEIVVEATWYVLHALMMGGSIVAVALGICLLIAPQRVWNLSRYLNKWFATSKLTAPLDAPRHIERRVYRHHRKVGAALLVGAPYTLYMLTFHYDPQAALNTLGRGLNPNLVAWLLESIVFMLISGSILAIVIALVLIARPSLLRKFETWSNRWYHTDKALKPLETMILTPDEVIMRHPHITAAIFILGGLYVLVSFGLGRL